MRDVKLQSLKNATLAPFEDGLNTNRQETRRIVAVCGIIMGGGPDFTHRSNHLVRPSTPGSGRYDHAFSLTCIRNYAKRHL